MYHSTICFLAAVCYCQFKRVQDSHPVHDQQCSSVAFHLFSWSSVAHLPAHLILTLLIRYAQNQVVSKLSIVPSCYCIPAALCFGLHARFFLFVFLLHVNLIVTSPAASWCLYLQMKNAQPEPWAVYKSISIHLKFKLNWMLVACRKGN